MKAGPKLCKSNAGKLINCVTIKSLAYGFVADRHLILAG